MKFNKGIYHATSGGNVSGHFWRSLSLYDDAGHKNFNLTPIDTAGLNRYCAGFVLVHSFSLEVEDTSLLVGPVSPERLTQGFKINVL